MTQTFNLSQIMNRAWTIRKEYAAKVNCPVGQVLMGECLKMAWAQAKAQDVMTKEKLLGLIRNSIATEKWPSIKLGSEVRHEDIWALCVGGNFRRYYVTDDDSGITYSLTYNDTGLGSYSIENHTEAQRIEAERKAQNSLTMLSSPEDNEGDYEQWLVENDFEKYLEYLDKKAGRK